MKRMRNAKMARALTTDPSQVCGEEGEGEGQASVRGSVSAVSTISRKPTGPHNRYDMCILHTVPPAGSLQGHTTGTICAYCILSCLQGAYRARYIRTQAAYMLHAH